MPEASEVGCEGSTVCLRLVKWVVRGCETLWIVATSPQTYRSVAVYLLSSIRWTHTYLTVKMIHISSCELHTVTPHNAIRCIILHSV